MWNAVDINVKNKNKKLLNDHSMDSLCTCDTNVVLRGPFEMTISYKRSPPMSDPSSFL